MINITVKKINIALSLKGQALKELDVGDYIYIVHVTFVSKKTETDLTFFNSRIDEKVLANTENLIPIIILNIRCKNTAQGIS